MNDFCYWVVSQMATRILRNSVNLLSTKLSKFGRLSLSTKSVTSDLKQQQQCSVQNNKNNKLKLVVRHVHKGSKELSLLSTNDNSLRSITCPVINKPIASSNAAELLLCYSNKGRPALWNPTTDYLKILPKSSLPLPPSVDTLREFYHGFGFDPASQEDYKVVRFFYFMFECEPGRCSYYVELYSLRTDSWKEIAFPPSIFIVDPGDCIHINRFYYWLAFDNLNRVDVLLRFDFASDEFPSSNIPLPETDMLKSHGEDDTYILVEFEGSLAVLAYSLADVLGTDEKPYEFEIWVWNDNDESWTRKRVSQITIPAGSAGVGRPLGLFKNDKLYLEGFMGEVVLFDCGNGRLTNTGLRFDHRWFCGNTTIFLYVESSTEEIKHRKIILNSTTSKLAPIVTADSKQKHNNNNKLKLLIDHKHEGIHYFFHLSTTNNNSSRDDDARNELFFFNFPSLGNYLCPLASCNTALLLCEVGLKGAALWNPTTDDVKKLPDHISLTRCHIPCYGFGFDPTLAAASQDHDYKVIRFIKNDYPNDLQVEMYSLKTDSWRDITSLYPHSECPPFQPCIHINDFSYWLAPEPDFSLAFIFSFDFANEKSSSAPHIPLPPRPRHELHLAEYHGSLAALVYTNVRRHHLSYAGHYKVIDERNEPFELEIWVWNNDESSSSSSSWSKVSIIHVPDVDLEEPLGLIRNDQLFLKCFNGEVLLYDYTKGGEPKNLGLIATHISLYVESSFPLMNGKQLIRASYNIIND